MNIIATTMTAALLGIAVLAPSLAAAGPAENPPTLMQSRGTGVDCVAKASAFTEVADLAYLYREDGDVFAGAIDELRDQLLDCLATSDDSEVPSAYPAGSDRLKLI